ncbi:glucose-specific phosphotransferase system IIA component [Mycoplasmoides fastidiosum]|uniref:Glucose-specific phosphotransferase system IIA component n=1 Tax=Mycoplasmoides fastidiosum TaxID=92758 RepID=A0ABU0LZE9_9BACT|nr:PTS glucose transporter subunit IIA [Mycoplasmoides fastidiosum]MDQ0514049.1 glucose-specific phosphotransferase system IIA component [Mycoplasmoides fastidiosum]UUD37540.1 PTS glucose transporter subunit IIA [Mycoplasmoides fastidiosum]
MNFIQRIKNLFGAKKTNSTNIYAPVDGTLVDLKNVPDEAFSSGMLGKGLAIKPDNGAIYTFMKGSLEVSFDTGHAYVFQDPVTEVTVLLHLGVDTVNLSGENPFTKEEIAIKTEMNVGTKLCEMNLDLINQNAKSDHVMVLVQNDTIGEHKIVFHKTSGQVKKGELLFTIE